MRTQSFFIIFLLLALMVSPAAADKKGVQDKDTLKPTTIKNMGVTRDGDAELFCLDFTTARVPDLQTIDDEKNPRVFFDVIKVAEWNGQPKYDIKGNMIRQVRTGYTKGSQRLRVVLDLNAIYNYNIEPSFDERYNLFCVAISARNVR